jgi:hypothetical protein
MAVREYRMESGYRPTELGHTAPPHLAADDIYTAAIEKLEPDHRELLGVALSGLGHHLLDHSGDRIGKIVGVLVDRETGAPQWLAVHARHRREAGVGVPAAGLSNAGGHLWTPLDATLVRNAPIVGNGRISGRIEQALCRYYRLPLTRGAAKGRWERRATCGRAFRDPDNQVLIRWLPGPRGDLR